MDSLGWFNQPACDIVAYLYQTVQPGGMVHWDMIHGMHSIPSSGHALTFWSAPCGELKKYYEGNAIPLKNQSIMYEV